MTGYQAAMGLAQFRKIDHIINEKRRVAQTYSKYLEDIQGLQLPVELDWALNVYWMYAIVINPEFGLSRDELAEVLWEDGIQTRTFFCPMNQQPVLNMFPGFREVPCPVADRLWDSGLYLPSAWNISEQTIKFVVNSIRRAVH